MIDLICTIFLFGGSLISIFIVLFFPNKRIIGMNHRHENILMLHLRSQKILDLIIGFVFILLGVFLIMDMFTVVEISLLTSINFFISKLVGVMLNKRYVE